MSHATLGKTELAEGSICILWKDSKLACRPGLNNKLFLNGVVLTNVGLDLLDDGTVLNLNGSLNQIYERVTETRQDRSIKKEV